MENITHQGITHSELVKTLVKNPADIAKGLSPDHIDLWHGATGVAGEGGELLEAVLLYNTHQIPLEELRVRAVEELGDLEFYLEQIRQRLHWTREPIDANNAPISPDMLLRHTAEVAIQGCNILDDIKKVSIYGKQLDTSQLIIHMAAIDYAMDAVRLSLGISRRWTLDANIEKLSERYAGLKYSDKAATERPDKKVPERKFFGQEQTEVKVPLSPPPGNPDE
jgi:hypothetical protein